MSELPSQALGDLVAKALDPLTRFTPLWRYIALCVAPHLPSRIIVPLRPPAPLTFTFRQELSAMPVKVFYPGCTIPVAPKDQDVAEQDFRFRVDDGEEQVVPVPLADEPTPFELPVGLRVGQRCVGSYGLIDDSTKRNRAAVPFDFTITEDMDTTAPLLPEGFTLGEFSFRQAFADETGAEIPNPAPVGEAPAGGEAGDVPVAGGPVPAPAESGDGAAPVPAGEAPEAVADGGAPAAGGGEADAIVRRM